MSELLSLGHPVFGMCCRCLRSSTADPLQYLLPDAPVSALHEQNFPRYEPEILEIERARRRIIEDKPAKRFPPRRNKFTIIGNQCLERQA